MNVRSASLPLLKNKIEDTLGKRILSYKECTELSEDVYKKTGTLISLNTLRRMFGIIKGSHLPSFSTLNTLAQYCGYNSVNDFLPQSGGKPEETENKELLSYIVSLFKNTVVPDINDATYLNLVRHTVQFLAGEPRLMEPFQRAIAKTKNGQNFYFEQFINIDKLNGFYGEGLKYYLTEKRTPEGQLFGNALLAFRYYPTGQDGLFFTHAQKVAACELCPRFHPFLSGRYFGTLLLAAKVGQKDVSAVLKKAREFYTGISPSKDHLKRFPSFEATFCASLLLAGEYKEALFYLNRAFKKQKEDSPTGNNRLFAHSFHLFKAIALACTDRLEEAEHLYEIINPSEFYFLSKRFHFILYIRLGKKLRKTKNDEAQLHHLIAETGFSRMEKLVL